MGCPWTGRWGASRPCSTSNTRRCKNLSERPCRSILLRIKRLKSHLRAGLKSLPPRTQRTQRACKGRFQNHPPCPVWFTCHGHRPPPGDEVPLTRPLPPGLGPGGPHRRGSQTPAGQWDAPGPGNGMPHPPRSRPVWDRAALTGGGHRPPPSMRPPPGNGMPLDRAMGCLTPMFHFEHPPVQKLV